MSKKQSQTNKNRTLISIVSNRDPYFQTLLNNTEQSGPLLALLSAERFQNVILLSQPYLKTNSEQTKVFINKLYPQIKTEIFDFNVEDPINYIEILKEMRKIISSISEKYNESEFYVNASSGTPQMHAMWILMAASGEIPAHIINIREKRHLSNNKLPILELDLTSPEFPIVRKNFTFKSNSDANIKDIQTNIQQLGIIADHPSMQKVLEQIAILAPIDRSVLILGETGTGKEVMARLFHKLSNRSNQNFIAVNCGAIPKDLAESVLFGHKKGSFTGAISDAKGKFKEAENGIIFLDELAELSEAAQVKLLRVLQTCEIEPVGQSKTEKVNVRIIAATNGEILKLIENGKFREDLYHRIAKSVIHLPALRERKTDIPKIALQVLDKLNKQLNKSKRITPEALLKLQNHVWSGNIRELENIVENAAIFSRSNVIEEEEIMLNTNKNKSAENSIPVPEMGFILENYLSYVRKNLIEKALEISNNNQSEAARILGISPQAVHKFLNTSK